MAKPSSENGKAASRDVAVNRRALHDYEILERVEAGIALTGSEIKSARAGKVSLQEAYARPERGLTIVPLRMYLKDGLAKVELAVARGRRQYDKRQAIARREAEREMERALRRGPARP